MDKITFKINDELHSVGSEISSDLTLLDYIRNVAELRGTKYMCREGGCGACVVGAVKTPGTPIQAVNSCLVSVMSCQGWEVTSVEKVGNKLDGYSPVQTTLAEHHGSQCGYCTPGWVMAMHSLIQGKKNLTPIEIEKSFGSNICRCTGYRPIMDAFKKFATDSQDLLDIEELKICKKTGEHCANRKDSCGEDDDWCLVLNEEVAVTHVVLSDGRKWYRVNFAAEIFTILNKEGNDSYMLVSGNTAKVNIINQLRAYPMHEYPTVLIDISSVNELKGFYLDQNLVIGSGVTLSELLDIFESMYNDENFRYLKKFYDHLNLVAHIAVRNNNPGVIAFYSSKDIPGVNFFTPSGILYSPMHEEILATDQIMYFNQPIGIIVADTHAGAKRAAKLVTAKYKNIEGAFIMGIGYWTSEELVYDKKCGEVLTDRTWNYYVPQARDIPQNLRVYLKKNSYSSDEFFGAKASGEPPICLSVVVTHALREAIAQARLESGIPTTQWFNIDGPYTLEKICMSTATKTEDFKFY